MRLTSVPTQQTRRTTGETTRTTRSVFRIARVIAIGGVVGLFACEEATAPEETDQLDLAGPSLAVAQTTPLGMIGTSLLDATNWVLPSINSAGKRADMSATLQDLASHLTTGAWDAARADVTKARAIRASLDATDEVEIGPIEVSLDQTDNELKAIGK
jgi:hypothetical protein